jgi:hypothetical protein
MIALLEPHDNHEWRSGLIRTELPHWDKAVLQKVPLHSSRCANIEGPFMENPNPTMNRHTTTVCGGRHILRVVMFSPWSVN